MLRNFFASSSILRDSSHSLFPMATSKSTWSFSGSDFPHLRADLVVSHSIASVAPRCQTAPVGALRPPGSGGDPPKPRRLSPRTPHRPPRTVGMATASSASRHSHIAISRTQQRPRRTLGTATTSSARRRSHLARLRGTTPQAATLRDATPQLSIGVFRSLPYVS